MMHFVYKPIFSIIFIFFSFFLFFLMYNLKEMNLMYWIKVKCAYLKTNKIDTKNDLRTLQSNFYTEY